jgi:predicted O-methyltransferase YrrM
MIFVCRINHTAYNRTSRDVQSHSVNEDVRQRARKVLAIGMRIDAASSPVQALAPEGTLIVMDADPRRAEDARRYFSSAGFGSRATVIGGDPRRMLYKLAGPFDVIFYDAAYVSKRESLERLLAPDGVMISSDDK